VTAHGHTVVPVSSLEAARWEAPKHTERSARHAPSALRSF
jgi:hypothetical protein